MGGFPPPQVFLSEEVLQKPPLTLKANYVCHLKTYHLPPCVRYIQAQTEQAKQMYVNCSGCTKTNNFIHPIPIVLTKNNINPLQILTRAHKFIHARMRIARNVVFSFRLKQLNNFQFHMYIFEETWCNDKISTAISVHFFCDVLSSVLVFIFLFNNIIKQTIRFLNFGRD